MAGLCDQNSSYSDSSWQVSSLKGLWEGFSTKQAAGYAGGNAYNQRAVLAAYAAHELDAVYGYIRSLSVAIPFTIARENLNQLFEQIRQRHQKLPERSASRTGPRSLRGCKLPELMRSVETRFLHLHGQLCTTFKPCTGPQTQPSMGHFNTQRGNGASKFDLIPPSLDPLAFTACQSQTLVLETSQLGSML